LGRRGFNVSSVNYIDNTIMGNALAPYENFCNQLENVIRTFIGVFTESVDSEQDKITIESDLLSERLWVLEKKAHTIGIDPKIVPKDKIRFSGLQIYNKTLLDLLNGDDPTSHSIFFPKKPCRRIIGQI
jgi:hypothetical protein